MKKISILFAISFFIWGCDFEQVIELEIPLKSQLVLNGAFCPDSSLTVHLSKTTAAVGVAEPPAFVNNAKVTAWEDNKLLGNLTWAGVEGRFTLKDFYPQPGKTYRIKATSVGFPDVEAETTIPEPIKLRANISKQETIITLDFTLDDNPAKKNIYMVSAYKVIPPKLFSVVGYPPYTIPQSVMPQYCVMKAIFIPQSQFNFENSEIGGLYCGNRLTFNDLLMKPEGNTFTLNVYNEGDRDGSGGYVFVGAISEEITKYDTTLGSNQNNGAVLGNEPSNVYGNVKGGLGLLASYNGVRYKL